MEAFPLLQFVLGRAEAEKPNILRELLAEKTGRAGKS